MTKQEKIEEFLNEIFKQLKIKPTLMIHEDDDGIQVDIEGNNLNFLIGYHGESLEALQNLVNLVLFSEFNDYSGVVVDINGYRQRRKDKIEEITKNFIDKARMSQEAVEMPPMKPFERRFIHVFVAEYPDIESESVGDGYDRRVVLKIKN